MCLAMNQWPPPPPDPQHLAEEIEKLKGIVGKYFPIYNVQVHFDTISLYCNVDKPSLENRFEELRVEMKGMSYIPILTYDKGEHVIHVVRQPKMKFKSNWVNIILLIATIFTTILAGSALWGSVTYNQNILDLGNLLNGALYFALPLMLILGIHELAHYYAARRHGIAASLPFFIPIPPLFIIPIGTMGAFISIREPIPNKKALLDIGVSGPIAGLLIAIPVTIIGLMLSASMDAASSIGVAEGGSVFIGESIFFFGLRSFIPVPENVLLHPTAFAGWVGLFVTALNLLPAGQLDGGHIARALFGEKAKYASYGAFGLMIMLGLFTSYTGWLVFALLIMFLGMRHPPPLNDVTKLDNKRKAFGVVAAVILLLCFVPVPFEVEESNYDVSFNIVMYDGSLTETLSIAEYSLNTTWLNRTEEVRLSNGGNVYANVSLTARSTNTTLCNVSFSNSSNSGETQTWVNMSVLESTDTNVYLQIAPGSVGNVTVTVEATYYFGEMLLDPDAFELTEEVVFHLNIR